MDTPPPLTVTKDNYKSHRSAAGKGCGRRKGEDREAFERNYPFPEPKRNYGWVPEDETDG